MANLEFAGADTFEFAAADPFELSATFDTIELIGSWHWAGTAEPPVEFVGTAWSWSGSVEVWPELGAAYAYQFENVGVTLSYRSPYSSNLNAFR